MMVKKKYLFGTIENFWKVWEKNSKINIEKDKVDFIFFSDDKEKLNLFIDFSKKYKESNSILFSGEELKKIIIEQANEKIIFNIFDEEFCIEKDEYICRKLNNYSENLKKIYVLGNNIDLNISKYNFSNKIIENIESKNQKGILNNFFINEYAKK